MSIPPLTTAKPKVASVNARPRRVLIVGSSQGVYGGIEVFMLALAEYFARQSDWQPELCFKIVSGYEIQDSFRRLLESPLCPVVITRRGRPEIFRAIRRADAVLCQNVPPDVVFTARALRKPVVATIHNYLPPADSPHWASPQDKLRRAMWRLSARLTTRRTYNARYVRASWESDAESPYSQVIPTVSQLPQRETVPPGERAGFSFVGRLLAEKGADLLIEAYRRAGLDPARYPLTIMGTGPRYEAIREQLLTAPVAGVTLTGFVAEEEKYDIMARSRWLVAPPESPEDMGLTPIEARCLGVPAIVADHGGLPESGGPAAIRVIPGNPDALAEALRQAASMSEDEYARRAELARSSLDNYLCPLDAYAQLLREAGSF